MHRNRPVIGLAGGIGAGKSAVAEILREQGCIICDSDAFGRAALNEPDIRDQLIDWWGEGILDAAGQVDRSKIARIVFQDADQRKRLESLTHPWIEQQRRRQFDAAESSVPAFVIDAPLLFEAGLDRECDAILFVDAPREIRLKRIEATRGWNADELTRRELSQMALDEKRSRSDYVVENHGDRATLRSAVFKAFLKITHGCRS